MKFLVKAEDISKKFEDSYISVEHLMLSYYGSMIKMDLQDKY